MGERTGHRYEALDSLRGLAAVTVALFHFNTARGIVTNAAFVHNGFLLVDFFFVLSGFVIAATYQERLAVGFPIRDFLLLRLGRLYPLHLAVIAALVAFEAAQWLAHKPDAFAGEHGPAALAACLLLVQTFVGRWGLPWNGPSWSIAVEFWTYAAFALGCRLFGRFVVPAALAGAASALLWLAGWSDRGLNLLHEGAWLRCLYGFGLGVVAHALHARLAGRRLAPGAATAAELLVAALAVALVCAAGPVPLSFALPPVFVMVVLVFAAEGGAVSRGLRRPLFVGLGTLSYSIYMIHQPLWYRYINLLAAIDARTGGRWQLIAPGTKHTLGGSAWQGDLLALLALVLTIAVARATWAWIERPGQAWSRRRILGRHPPRALARDEHEAAPIF